MLWGVWGKWGACPLSRWQGQKGLNKMVLWKIVVKSKINFPAFQNSVTHCVALGCVNRIDGLVLLLVVFVCLFKPQDFNTCLWHCHYIWRFPVQAFCWETWDLWNPGCQGGAEMPWESLGVAFSAEAHNELRELKLARDGEGRKAECSVWLLPPEYTGFLVSSISWLVPVLCQLISSHGGLGHTLRCTQRQSKGTRQWEGVVLEKVWGGMGERREILHRRLTREGAALCKKGKSTRKSWFACCNRQKGACRSEL